MNSEWEKALIEKLATSSLVEQRRRRRWGIFFKLIAVVYVGAFLVLAVADFDAADPANLKPHVALVKLDGVIAPDTKASAEKVIDGLRAAFESKQSQAIVLRINSPGGSPVQAGMINDEILRLRGKYPDKPLYAVIEEICASGGYYVAAAADSIYADKASLVGSIGVLINDFGFTEAMEKIGVERRLITAGEHKGFLDPYSPSDPNHVAYAQQMIDAVHQQFIDVVKKGRGDRLAGVAEDELFSGLVWNGERGVELGLIDDLGSVQSVARDVVQIEELVDYTEKESFAERFASRMGAKFATGFTQAFFSSGSVLQ